MCERERETDRLIETERDRERMRSVIVSLLILIYFIYYINVNLMKISILHVCDMDRVHQKTNYYGFTEVWTIKFFLYCIVLYCNDHTHRRTHSHTHTHTHTHTLKKRRT